jgi:1-acyl-sn-glycerol-3-phosphate acyltransferase
MFVVIFNFFHTRVWLPRLLFVLTLGLFLFLASRIRFGEDVNSMLPESRDIRAMNEALSHTQAGEQLIFLASFKDTSLTDRDSLIALTTAYYEGLQKACGDWIDTASLQAGGGIEEGLADLFNSQLPLFLTDADYRVMDTLTRPERIRATLAENRRVLLSPASVVYKGMVTADPVGISRTVWGRLATLQYDPSYELYEGYVFSVDGRRLTFFLKPKYASAETGINSRFFKALNAYTDSFAAAEPNLHVTYFGGAAVAAGNATQMRTDTMVTLSVTIILLMALTYYYFRRKRTPLLLLLPVLYGAALGLAVVYLLQGGISIIALGAGAIVMGIAIDYSIHFLSHARKSGDMRETIRELQAPLTIGSFTTIAAFLSLRLVHLPLLRDLGLFAAVSLMGAALCTLIFLPHFPLGAKSDREPVTTVFDKLARLNPARSKWLLWTIILLTPVMGWWSTRVQFDHDLMHLNYLSPRLKAAGAEVTAASSYALSSMFVIGSGASEDEALHKLEGATPLIDSLRQRGLVRAASNPAMLIPSAAAQKERAQRWQAYWTEERKAEVILAIRDAAHEEGFSPDAFTGFEAALDSRPGLLHAGSVERLKMLFPGGFSEGNNGLKYAVASLKVPQQHRQAVLAALSGVHGIIVTDRQQGASRMAQILTDDFQSVALYSSMIVFFALLIAYGRIELAVISFLPMVISWVWILGLMALLGIKFNIVNIIISTLIFGLGDDYSIFTLDGLMERYRTRSDHTSSVRAAVYVSVATVLIGLGALLLAKHPALRSIAAISITGMLCVLLISQTLQPALFGALIQRRADRGQHPFTAWSLAKSTFAFLYFVTCSIVVSLAGIVLIRLWPFDKEKGKMLFHRLLRRGTWSVLYIMGNVKKRVINRRLADFSKPAVYIANHTSFLDILLVTALHPRVVLLTNKWVYRSPVFGAVVRMGEYYPVADGAEDSLEPLRDLTARGYSIVVFPEGTRSLSDRIQRFHKGAFFIAERLRLDIVPLLIHGAHYTMSKGDWLLKDGELNVYIHPRIPPGVAVTDDMLEIPTAAGRTFAAAGRSDRVRLGATYSERAKGFGRWFRQALERVKEQRETPAYFREQIIRSYTYKGPVLEWYCRIKTRLEGNYETFHRLLPREGRIYDLGCGYGFAAYMLHWAAAGRQITGVDYDPEKIAVAQALHLRNAAITFEAADLRGYALSAAGAILITDVLHYLLPAAQEALLLRCVEALEPGGMLIVRDGVVELEARQRRTALTEIFSTRILGFNRTTNELHFISRSAIMAFAERHALSLEIIDEAKYTSNLVFVLRKAR